MAERKFRIGIAGASGYIGSELMRILCTHPNVEIAWVTSESNAGKRVHELFPNLLGYIREEFAVWDISLCADVDAVCLCLPHGGAMAAATEISTRFPKLKIVDASGDFRSPVIDKWEQYYKTKHTAPELQKRFVYGAPEFNRQAIKAAQYIASPGCFATSLNLLLAPFAKHGELVGEVCVTGITGSSGSGNKPMQTTHHPERAQNVRAYKVLEHQHLVEVVPFLEGLNKDNDFDLFFVPQSGPFVRGIFSTAFIPLNNHKSMATFNEIVRDAYENEPFVQIVKDTPEMRLVQGTNNAHLMFRAQGDMMVGLCAIDNLVKGGAGQAVQNLNLILGLEETAGLQHPAGYV
ncbi:MAG: N-acetyl-gamma-glutamyl-phosphate reductase [Planctomycetes bacterium]|nr:N-acetyl-gamma-glutamyl-phosphate reductase [Planctomycetota bacterium]